VLFVEDAEKADVSGVGPELEHSPLFVDRTNVEFAQVKDRKHIRMRVWERGSGITQACGTGACGTAVAAVMAGLVDADGCEIAMDGGALNIRWDEASGHVFMTGTATKVFEGEISL
jgi:diaminopimelate epimerase